MLLIIMVVPYEVRIVPKWGKICRKSAKIGARLKKNTNFLAILEFKQMGFTRKSDIFQKFGVWAEFSLYGHFRDKTLK